MKPVERGANSTQYSGYKKAKSLLLARLGEQCTYCERSGDPQDLHVEHIYPKDPHPELELEWTNFLLACNTCNTYKSLFLGNGKQVNLEDRFAWPHLDNTFGAYVYKSTGEVLIAPTVPPAMVPTLEATRDMVGLMLSPAVADNFQRLGIAYDGANKRSQMWGIAQGFSRMFIRNPSQPHAESIANGAAVMGYFSVWMEVFAGVQQVRLELIRAFRADPNFFDNNTNPLPKGRL